MWYRLLFAIGLAVASTFFVAGQVIGGAYLNTIEETAMLRGRHLRVTVIIGCDAGQRLKLRVTTTQRHVGAVAEGRQETTCTGDTQHIPVDITTRGRQHFVPATASDSNVVEACVLAMTSSQGHIDDSHQWCKDVSLTSTQ